MELKEIVSRRFRAAVSHQAWSKALSLAIAVAVRVDSFGQGMPQAVIVIQDHFISVSVEEGNCAGAGN